MPVTFHSGPRSSQQKGVAADTHTEPREAKKTKQGQKLRGIDQVKDPRVRNIAEEASIMFRQQSLFAIPFSEDVDEMVAAAWIKAHGLWEFDDSVPQQPALEHVAYATPLDILWY